VGGKKMSKKLKEYESKKLKEYENIKLRAVFVDVALNGLETRIKRGIVKWLITVLVILVSYKYDAESFIWIDKRMLLFYLGLMMGWLILLLVEWTVDALKLVDAFFDKEETEKEREVVHKGVTSLEELEEIQEIETETKEEDKDDPIFKIK
jgi:hypothetical protein